MNSKAKRDLRKCSDFRYFIFYSYLFFCFTIHTHTPCIVAPPSILRCPLCVPTIVAFCKEKYKHTLTMVMVTVQKMREEKFKLFSIQSVRLKFYKKFSIMKSVCSPLYKCESPISNNKRQRNESSYTLIHFYSKKDRHFILY